MRLYSLKFSASYILSVSPIIADYIVLVHTDTNVPRVADSKRPYNRYVRAKQADRVIALLIQSPVRYAIFTNSEDNCVR